VEEGRRCLYVCNFCLFLGWDAMRYRMEFCLWVVRFKVQSWEFLMFKIPGINRGALC
jgi:hypothetical protein